MDWNVENDNQSKQTKRLILHKNIWLLWSVDFMDCCFFFLRYSLFLFGLLLLFSVKTITSTSVLVWILTKHCNIILRIVEHQNLFPNFSLFCKNEKKNDVICRCPHTKCLIFSIFENMQHTYAKHRCSLHVAIIHLTLSVWKL